MIVKIEYRDKQNWTKEVTGQVVEWTTPAKKYARDLVQPYFVRPVDVTDIWNGKDSLIQQVGFEGHYTEFYIQENGINFVQQLSQSSEITITNITQDANGNNLETIYNDIDLTLAQNLEISEPERINTTSSWKVSIIFRTGRTVMNKALPVDFTNNIQFNKATNQWALSFENSIPGKLSSFNSHEVISLNNSILQKYKRVGNEWVKEGASKFILGLGSNQDVAVLDDNNVAVIGDGVGFLSKYNFANQAWSLVGNATNLPGNYDAPSITGLSATRIAIYDTLTQDLATYDHDGTDWSLVGNALNFTTSGSVYIEKLTSSKIAMFDMLAAVRDFDFDGTDWTQNQNIFFSSVGSGDICRLSSTRVATYTENTGILRSYTLTSDWALDSGQVTPGGTGSALAGLEENEVYLTCDTSGHYNYGVGYYYSDYDVLDWNKATDDVNVEWFDGTIKKAQRINKNGFEYVQYLSTSDHDQFIKDLKSTNDVTINGTSINEVEFETALVAEDLYKIIVRGVSETTNNTDYLDTNQDYNIIVNGNTYYTDYRTEIINEASEIDTFNNQDGINRTSKSISKTVRQMKFYKNETDTFALRDDFVGFGQSSVINPGAINVLENRDPEINRLGDDLYEIVINCLTAANTN